MAPVKMIFRKLHHNYAKLLDWSVVHKDNNIRKLSIRIEQKSYTAHQKCRLKRMSMQIETHTPSIFRHASRDTDDR